MSSLFRAAGAARGVLARGREGEQVQLIELPLDERAAILRALPRGVGFFRLLYGVPAAPDKFAALAPGCPVFRIEEANG